MICGSQLLQNFHSDQSGRKCGCERCKSNSGAANTIHVESGGVEKWSGEHSPLFTTSDWAKSGELAEFYFLDAPSVVKVAEFCFHTLPNYTLTGGGAFLFSSIYQQHRPAAEVGLNFDWVPVEILHLAF